MQFINPIELLSLQDLSIQEIDTAVIRKSKRKIQAEIELSENAHINYHGIQVNHSETERAISELDEKDNIEFYHYIANNKKLNSFLVLGNESIFSFFQQESIYKLPAFINLISPYFAEKYDKALLDAFQNDNEAAFKRIITIPPLVLNADKDKAYRSISIKLKERIKETEDLSKEIINEESAYSEKDVDEVFDWIKEFFLLNIINALPGYFQSLRNQVASSIRNLSVNIFNSFGDSQLALDMINYALQFKIDGLTNQRLADDLKQISEINELHLEEERQAPLLTKAADVIIGIRRQVEEIDKNSTSLGSVKSWVSGNISASEINQLDDSFIEIRNQIAYGLRAISVGVWNKYNDINVALNIINIAININTNSATKNKLNEDKKQLSELKQKIDLLLHKTLNKDKSGASKKLRQSNPTTSTFNRKGCLISLAVIAILLIIVSIINSDRDVSPSISTGESASTPPTYTKPIREISPFKGNQLNNGISPFDECFGKGWYEGQAWIRFDNSNATDAIVCLVNLFSERTVRNEYIQAGTSFTMNRIPGGTYFLKVYYGNDWNPNMRNFCGTAGAFETGAHFSKSDNPDDYIQITNSEYSYTTGSITLYAVPNGNMSSESTTASDFFKN